MYEEGEEREKESSQRSRERQRAPSPWGGRDARMMKRSVMHPLFFPLKFNYEPVDADPSLRRLTLH